VQAGKQRIGGRLGWRDRLPEKLNHTNITGNKIGGCLFGAIA
jgi:hypothetical protein